MHRKREAQSRRRALMRLTVAVAASLAVGLVPPAAGAQDDPGGYLPSDPPEAPGGNPGGGGGGGTFGSAATGGSGATAGTAADGTTAADDSSGVAGTVTDSSGSLDELPVTGLPAIPLALAGLVMLMLGALGLRRFSDRPASEEGDPSDPSGTRRILGR